ncbi:hypothetical protein [Streptomyces sp. NRRL B-24484]|uniref:hypothetical protein n=1 Tax=Streptomyces sp. NRRL B-24484 TaxID=1463833 RepID=UPI0004C16BA1|nr:hypothetical protein [Streptomyces sp. NRRL B-24484]
MSTAHQPFTYTGETDPYRSGGDVFPGPHVRNAAVLGIEAVSIPSPSGDGTTLPRPAVRLTLASTADRGPREVQATGWGTPADWRLHPAHLPNTARARLVTDALTAVGIPARTEAVGHELYCTAVDLTTRSGLRTLYVGMEDTLVWELLNDDPDSAQPGGVWRDTFPDDAPGLVRRFARRARATFAGITPDGA